MSKIILVLLILLSSCGGGSTAINKTQVTKISSLFNSECNLTNIFYKPTKDSIDPVTPINSLYAIVRYQGTPSVNFNCTSLSSIIDSTKFMPEKVIGGGPGTIFSQEFNPYINIYQNQNSGLLINLDLQIPQIVVIGNDLAQANLYLYFHDIKSDVVFAYVVELYDSRINLDLTENILNDTYVNFISTKLTQTSKYTTLINSSDITDNKISAQFKHYEVFISYKNFLLAISDINKKFNTSYNLNPEDYRLSLVGAGTEITNPLEGSMYFETNFKNFAAFIGEVK